MVWVHYLNALLVSNVWNKIWSIKNMSRVAIRPRPISRYKIIGIDHFSCRPYNTVSEVDKPKAKTCFCVGATCPCIVRCSSNDCISIQYTNHLFASCGLADINSYPILSPLSGSDTKMTYPLWRHRNRRWPCVIHDVTMTDCFHVISMDDFTKHW